MKNNPELKPYYNGKNITLYNAKYEDLLPTLKPSSIDLLLTDPPYNTTNLEWDTAIDWAFFWNEAHRLCKPKSPMVLFASGQFVNKLINTNQKNYRYELIWEKNIPVGFLDANRRPLRSHENIIFFSQLYRGSTYNPQMIEGKMHERGKGGANKARHYSMPNKIIPKVKTNLYHPRSILRFSRDKKSLHPTQKPLELMRWLVRSYSNRIDIILEPFAGSGSTLVAASLEGRKAIGCEQSEEYCEIIAKRLENGE
ncbi:MAG TPA: site-specific DNA-methyltransferase [Pyrinomonadaceae bacterium]|nr:site-specific DNA-methyltransferase [Pyrinomonadaceae bacterium]